MKLEELKKVSLGSYPTPLEKMEHLTEKYGKGPLYIKRDDTTGPAFGGNKTRKLEYIIKDALDQGYTAMLTVGGPQTNHGRTTVAAAIKYGLKPILVLGGKMPEYLSGNLTLDAMMGADVYFTANREGALEEIIQNYEQKGEKVYNLPVGGSTVVGTAGYIMAAKEMVDQCKAMGIAPKYLVCAAGSIGTFGGLILGAKYFNAPFEVVGIPVQPAKEDRRPAIADFINKASEHYELGVTVKPEDIRIEAGPEDAPYSGQAYNQPDPITRKAMFELASTEGIILDPTYTGKAYRGFTHLVQSGTFGNEGAIFLHTGGAVAVYTKEHLDAMQDELWENAEFMELTE